MFKRGVLVILAVLLAGCGPTSASGTAGSPQPSARAQITESEALAVADKTFPQAPQYGYYVVCGLDGNFAGCPYTERLKARLGTLKETLMRSQGPSKDRKFTFSAFGESANVRVELFGGKAVYNLTIVRTLTGQLLVDDETCAERKETSIYADPFVACMS